MTLRRDAVALQLVAAAISCEPSSGASDEAFDPIINWTGYHHGGPAAGTPVAILEEARLTAVDIVADALCANKSETTCTPSLLKRAST